MNLSHKLTFSLASIFLLLAFAIVPAMAHSPGDDSYVGDHATHPILEDVTDANPDVDGDQGIEAHANHPRPTISVKAGGNTKMINNRIEVKIVADDTATTDVAENAFTVVVQYDQAVAATATERSVADNATAPTLAATQFIFNKENTDGTDPTVAAATRVDKDTLEILITIADGNVPDADGTADNADDEYTYRIRIDAEGGFGIQTIPAGALAAVNGGPSLQSNLLEVVLVKELTADPPTPDSDPPMFDVVMNPVDRSALTAGQSVQFTLTANEALGSGNNELMEADVEGTTNVRTKSFIKVTNTQYVVIVVPTDHTRPIVLTIPANAVMDTASTPNGNAEKVITFTPADETDPTVEITAVPGTGADSDKVVFTFDFSEEITDFDETDIIVSTGTILAGLVTPAADNTMYTVLVTPSTTGPTTLTLRVGSVTDMAMPPNKLAAPASHTYSAPVPPGAATIATPAGGNVGDTTAGATITITFNKDPGTVTAMMGTTSVAVGGTSGTMRTITAAATAGTYSISLTWTGTDAGTSDDGSGTLTYTIPVQGVVSSANMLSNLSIPGKSFVLLTHETSMGLPTLPDNASTVVWNDMPDIESLFFSGGSINITVAGVGARSVLFTEFMWARNLAKIGTDGELAHQWIEIYNNNNDAVTATVRTKSGRPALPHATDRVSNVVGEGWKLENLGQNGSDDGEGGSAEMDFVSMYKKHKSAGDKDGSNKGHWGVSSNVYLALHKGTPGAFERSAVGTISATSFTVGGVIFNEIANRSDADKAYEWIELRNKTGGNINLKNWQISIVTAVGQDNAFITFPNADRVIGANSVLLLVASDPEFDQNHPLQTGWNITEGANIQAKGVGAHSPRYMVVSFAGNGLPDNGNFVLILRNHNNKRGKAEHLIDIAGYANNLKVSAEESGYTNLWPLKGGVRDAQLSNNKLEVNQVHRRQKDNIWGTSSTNYGRNGGNHHDDAAWRGVGWTAIGYKRNSVPSGMLGGTPGYQNNTLVNRGATAINNVIISEIMYDTSRNTPQWIELQNMSDTHGVDVNQWSIFVDNYHLMDADTDYTLAPLTNKKYDIDGFIPPNQTMLIVSHAARHHTMLPASRIHNLRMARGARLLNPYGFEIRLKSRTNEAVGKQDTIDVVGNLGDAPEGSRRSDAKSYADLRWMLPAGVNSDGVRVSLSRRTSGQVLNNANGRNAADWILSDQDSRMDTMFTPTYYGLSNDISSPGQTRGSVLPVQLSSFRPTLEDGKVTIRWATESELDNAGFNILRSETRNGEFTQVNEQMIQGKGTTAERTTYKWVDTTAKPGAVYYYQIEDVSFAGERTKLATTKLKGLISAKGKLTTQWGNLKNLR